MRQNSRVCSKPLFGPRLIIRTPSIPGDYPPRKGAIVLKCFLLFDSYVLACRCGWHLAPLVIEYVVHGGGEACYALTSLPTPCWETSFHCEVPPGSNRVCSQSCPRRYQRGKRNLVNRLRSLRPGENTRWPSSWRRCLRKIYTIRSVDMIASTKQGGKTSMKLNILFYTDVYKAVMKPPAKGLNNIYILVAVQNPGVPLKV